MICATFDELECLSDDGAVSGYQFGGRSRAIQEWQEAKEQEEFRRLCQRIGAMHYARRVRAEGGERAQKCREQLAAYRERNREKIRKREREIRRAKYEADPVVNVCEECGKEWSPPFEQKVRKSRFCCRKCRQRWHGRERTKEGRRRKGLRNMDLWPATIEALEETPWLTVTELAKTTGAKQHSLAVRLRVWVKAGKLIRRGKCRQYRYALPR